MSERRTEVIGRKKLPKKELIELDNTGLVQELAELINGTTGTEVVNVALNTLAWVLESKRRGKHIYASGAMPTDLDADELRVDLPAVSSFVCRFLLQATG